MEERSSRGALRFCVGSLLFFVYIDDFCNNLICESLFSVVQNQVVVIYLAFVCVCMCCGRPDVCN